MLVKKSLNFGSYIYPVSTDYLKEIENYLIESEIIPNTEKLLMDLDLLKSKFKNSDLSLKIINKLTMYIEGVSSSAIEDIVLNYKNQNKEEINKNKRKIDQYIQSINLIEEKYKGIINEEILVEIHDKLEPTKQKGIRINTSQYIGNHRAPDGKNLREALDNFWNLYYGKNEFDDIHYLMRYAFQHLLFETIHPFDDGNGRTGRILNLFFFKNQNHDFLDNFLIETSSNIFKKRDEYGMYLEKSRVVYKNQVYSSDKKKSIQRDSIFCHWFLSIFCEKLNYILEKLEKTNDVISNLLSILGNNKILNKYKDLLLNYFSENIYWNRSNLQLNTNLAEATISKIIKELENNNLIKNMENSKTKKVFWVFDEISKDNPDWEMLLELFEFKDN